MRNLHSTNLIFCNIYIVINPHLFTSWMQQTFAIKEKIRIAETEQRENVASKANKPRLHVTGFYGIN